MSDDEDNTCLFGTALPKLPEDVIPTKKPITVADQIAVDENGRRRFHGAFTGGFSAGFWNTVGSREGWQPQAFKSSRLEKAERVVQAPNDFMDAEDVGEFGIAPQRIQTTDDFTAEHSSSNRKRQAADRQEGPILGTPVLNLFLKPAKDKASVSLLKKMGWRENQGIGSRLTRKEKKKAIERATQESDGQRIYNCDLGPMQKQSFAEEDDEDEASSSDSDSEITFAPDDYEPLVHAFKTNRFGLGYSGLNKNPVLQQHINLFAPFEVLDKKNKKLSITGQAFGVGAFEEDDDDIYAKEDLATYDFSLEDKAPEKMKAIEKQRTNVLEGFVPSERQLSKKIHFAVSVPATFKPRNWALRKTRFGPVNADVDSVIDNISVGTKRHMLTPEERGNILNDEKPIKQPATTADQGPIVIIDEVTPKPVEKDAFIKLDEPEEVPEPVKPEAKPSPALNKLAELFGDRFVSEKQLLEKEPEPPVPEVKPVEVVMKRTKTSWSPCALLCQKMNIAEPMSSKANPNSSKSGSFSLFECLGQPSGSSRNRRRQREESREFTPALQTDDENSILLRTAKSNRSATRPATSNTTSFKVPIMESVKPPVSRAPLAKIVNVIPTKPKVKSELELKISEAESKHPAEKKDIYKAIFDSSDDESDTEKESSSASTTTLPVVPGTVSIPKLSKDVNVLRNTSPPRGIFANFLKKPSPPPPKQPPPTAVIQNKSDDQDKLNSSVEDNPHMYGPSLPTRVTPVAKPDIPKHEFTRKKPSTEAVTNRLFASTLPAREPQPPTIKLSTPLLPPPIVVEPMDTDEWIDKNDLIPSKISGQKKKDKHKKSKKHKKEKLKMKSKKKEKKSKKDKR